MKLTFLKTGIILACLASVFQGCLVEYFWHLKIKNSTDKEIELAVYFDRSTFEKAWKGSDYYEFLKTDGIELGSQIKLTSLDTDSLIGHYKISPQGYWEVSGMGRKPDFEEYKQFSVETANYVMTLPSHKAMTDNFKSDTEGGFIWHIE